MSDRTPPYAETILDFHTQHRFAIDLRQPIAPAAITRLGDAGLGEPFAVITACNPGGELLDADENTRQTARFEALLRRIGIAFTRVDGCSPDRTHREPGFAVRLPLEQARALALDFGQDALFWFDGEGFWLVVVDGLEDPAPLPRRR